MKIIFASQRQSFLLLATLLIVPSAQATTLSEVEVDQLWDNKNESYVYCDNNRGKIADIMAQVSTFNDDKYSPVKELHEHIQQGFSIARKDAVMEAVEYAQAMVHAHDGDQQLIEDIAAVEQALVSGELDVDIQSVNKSNAGCCPDQDNKNTVIKLREKLYAFESAKFFNNVEFKDDVTFKDNVTFKNDVTFKGDVEFNNDVTIAVTLAVAAATIDCDLTVGCNISMNDSVSGAIGNVIKDGNPFIHTYPGLGAQNTFVGENAGSFATSCLVSSAFGNGAMQNANATFDTAIGADALSNDQAGFNTAVGVSVLSSNTTGQNNTGMGYVALLNNTQGNRNTAVGDSTLLANTTGSFNTAVGMLAMNANTTGSLNVALGYTSLIGVTAGNNNIGLGVAAGSSLTGSDSNNIIIGNVGVAGDNGVIRIGTNGIHSAAFMHGINTVAIPGGVSVLTNASGQLGTTPSSSRFKHDIADMDVDSANIYKLRPVTFAYNGDLSETKQYGLIAEEVDAVFPGIVVKNSNGQPETVQYHVLPVLLLNEVQKLQAGIEAEKASREALAERVAHLEARA